ncbi:MAG: hypothetical protein AB1445_15990 [Bacillota bacterium]
MWSLFPGLDTGTVIDLGTGMGGVSAWAALCCDTVLAFDLSKTHCPV